MNSPPGFAGRQGGCWAGQVGEVGKGRSGDTRVRSPSSTLHFAATIATRERQKEANLGERGSRTSLGGGGGTQGWGSACPGPEMGPKWPFFRSLARECLGQLPRDFWHCALNHPRVGRLCLQPAPGPGRNVPEPRGVQLQNFCNLPTRLGISTEQDLAPPPFPLCVRTCNPTALGLTNTIPRWAIRQTCPPPKLRV